MIQGFKFRIGHAGAFSHTVVKRAPSATCSTGGFYKGPTSGQVINATQPLAISWDTTCLDISVADVYLYAPSNSRPLIQMFKDVDFQKGTFTTNLKPQWWNRTAEVDLQLAIIQSGTEPFMATLPAGPIFSAQYTPGSDVDSGSPFSSNATLTGVTEVNNLQGNSKAGLSKGAIAAAVIIPILVLGIALGVYMNYVRNREKKSRRRWSEAVDKRMSTISTDWRSLGHAGAEAAIRASIVSDANRTSFIGGQAGIGSANANGPQDMAQIRRPGVGLRGGVAPGSTERISRISFAADTRFSRSSVAEGGAARPRPNGARAGVPSRAFHSGYIPSNQGIAEENQGQGDRAMSPRQKEGPLPLSAAEIQERVQGIQKGDEMLTANSPSMDRDSVVMPALAMMRESNNSQADLILKPAPPISPFQPDFNADTAVAAASMRADLRSPPPAPPRSPVMEELAMQPMHAGVMMSPDDMLKVYSERRRAAASSNSSGSMSPMPAISFPFPLPVATPALASSQSPRTLYSPAANHDVELTDAFSSGAHARTRSKETHYNNEDAYGE